MLDLLPNVDVLLSSKVGDHPEDAQRNQLRWMRWACVGGGRVGLVGVVCVWVWWACGCGGRVCGVDACVGRGSRMPDRMDHPIPSA